MARDNSSRSGFSTTDYPYKCYIEGATGHLDKKGFRLKYFNCAGINSISESDQGANVGNSRIETTPIHMIITAGYTLDIFFNTFSGAFMGDIKIVLLQNVEGKRQEFLTFKYTKCSIVRCQYIHDGLAYHIAGQGLVNSKKAINLTRDNKDLYKSLFGPLMEDYDHADYDVTTGARNLYIVGVYQDFEVESAHYDANSRKGSSIGELKRFES